MPVLSQLIFPTMMGRRGITQRVLSTRQSNILAYWPLNETAGTTAAVTLCAAGQCLFNTGFETAGAGGADVFGDWVESAGDGTIADEGSIVHAGSHALKIVAGTNRNTNVYQTFAALPGKSYTLNIWCRGDGTNQGRIIIYDNTAAANITAFNTGVTGTAYALVTQAFTTPANCVSVRIYLYNPLVVGATTYYDDCTVTITAAQKGYDATSSGATVGQMVGGIPCYSFDGTNDFVNLITPSLANGFNGAEGTMLIYGRVSAAAEWTDGGVRYLYRFKTSDLVDAACFGKYSDNNTFFWQFNVNGTDRFFSKGSLTTTGWFTAGLTWSASGNVIQPYWNGAVGANSNTPGTPWDGRLTTRAAIGTEVTDTPATCWKGYAAHAVLWNVALTAAEMAQFASP